LITNQQELAKKENALARLQAIFQENKEAMKPSIATVNDSTITEATLVSSPSIETSQEHLGEFEKHTIGNGSKL
jgi:hypothetical protein